MTDTTERPLVTFAVIAYNQERFIREAIEGAFAQTYHPLEIILSDDCSPDRTFEIMQEMAAAYDGPHKVVLNRNELNLGLCGHFNKVVDKAKGAFVVVNAGDDISLPERTSMTVRELCRNQNLTYAETGLEKISHIELRLSGQDSATEKRSYSLGDFVKRRMTFHGAARTYRKSTLQIFPPLDPKGPTEDTTSLLRGLLCGDGVVLPETGLKWRVHDNNLSSAASLKRMPVLKIYEQYREDVLFAKNAGFLSSRKARRILGSLAYWILLRLARQKDTKLDSGLDKILAILGSRWLSLMEKIYVVEAILFRNRLKI